MTISNRRDAGYTIISRFEESFRETIESFIVSKYNNFFVGIPEGVVLKANDRSSQSIWDDKTEFLQNIDFPDLKEIALYKDHFNLLVKDKMSREVFISQFDELYVLRCKIAHIKGYFTSIDLDKLIEFTENICVFFSNDTFSELIKKIKTDPEKVIIKIPLDFSVDFLQDNGIANNIPTPDYEFEGGFVGRDLDKKKIIQYLSTDKFPVITITGAGGVGKTSLALRIIQEITQKPHQKPFEAIIWLSAKETRLSALGIEDIEPTLKNYEELLDTIISVFGLDNENASGIVEKEDLVQLIFSVSSKILIAVDNLETITDERIINFIIDAPINIKFLITSRKGLGQVEIRHELKQLKEKEAIYLFRQLAKDKQLLSLVSLSDDVIKKYVEKVSYYPLVIKWVIGQIGRGKDINKIIESISETESDISKFCFDQIFSSLIEESKKILYSICSFDDPPTSSILQYVVEQEDINFDNNIEELILVSLIIPEQFQNEKNEISRKFSILPLTKGYIRKHLSKIPEIRENIVKRIIDVENTITITEKAKKEYRHSLFNMGAKTDEEKVAAILAQTAFQKYQSGSYEDAVEDYKKAIKMAPGFSATYRNWGVMESYEGHLQEAGRLMEKAESLNNRDPQIYLLWGNVLRKNGKNNEALIKYQKAYDLAPEDHIILNAYGTTKGRLGDCEEADRLLMRGVESKNSLSVKHQIINWTSIGENLITWADILIKDRNYTEAEVKLNKAISSCLEALKIDNRDPKIHVALCRANMKKGGLYFKTGKTIKAAESFSKVFHSVPKSFKHHLFKITAGIELAYIYFHDDNIKGVKLIIKEIEREYKNHPIFKNTEYSFLQSRYNELQAKVNEDNFITGIITRVEPIHEFLIITCKNNQTYICSGNDFIPRLNVLTNDLINKSVKFSPTLKSGLNESKRIAMYVKFIL